MKIIAWTLLVTLVIGGIARADGDSDYKWLEDCFNGKVSAGKTIKKTTPEGTEEVTAEYRECHEKAEDFAKKNASNPSLVMRIAKLTGRNQNHVASVPIYKTALEKTTDLSNACADSDLNYAVKQALALPENDPNAKDAKWIAFVKCFSQMKDGLVESLTQADATSYYSKNTCADLYERKALKGLLAKRCAKK